MSAPYSPAPNLHFGSTKENLPNSQPGELPELLMFESPVQFLLRLMALELLEPEQGEGPEGLTLQPATEAPSCCSHFLLK